MILLIFMLFYPVLILANLHKGAHGELEFRRKRLGMVKSSRTAKIIMNQGLLGINVSEQYFAVLAMVQKI